MKPFKHVVITRFQYPEDKKELQNERMEFFKKYTLPSVKAQTSKDFTWIIFSKEDLGIDYEDIKYLTLSSYKEWKEELKKEYDYIIETRLDNDDIIHPNFIEAIQLSFMKNNFSIEFKGYRYDLRNGEFYEDLLYNSKFTSPFISLVSKLKDNYYIFDYDHGDVCKNFPTKFDNRRMWIQMIHDSNKLMNKDSEQTIKMRGRKCNFPDWFKNE